MGSFMKQEVVCSGRAFPSCLYQVNKIKSLVQIAAHIELLRCSNKTQPLIKTNTAFSEDLHKLYWTVISVKTAVSLRKIIN